jgi:hypothetical protein
MSPPTNSPRHGSFPASHLTAVLTSDSDRMLALLRKSGVIHNPVDVEL